MAPYKDMRKTYGQILVDFDNDDFSEKINLDFENNWIISNDTFIGNHSIETGNLKKG